MNQRKKLKLWNKILLIIAAILFLACLGFYIYISNYYHASSSALKALNEPQSNITVEVQDNSRIIFQPEDPTAGLIFYPGGKVQYEAYAPLMEACAQRGILCVLVHMPGNLAVLDVNAADDIQEEFPKIKNWYMAGHSLGGSMAASYIKSHANEYDGLVLLAAYSTEDLSQSGLNILSIYGSEDGVLNMDSYKKYKKNLPEDFTELIISGGCHSYFGSYGSQNGDGIPSITNESQISQTAEAIAEMIASKCN